MIEPDLKSKKIYRSYLESKVKKLRKKFTKIGKDLELKDLVDRKNFLKIHLNDLISDNKAEKKFSKVHS